MLKNQCLSILTSSVKYKNVFIDYNIACCSPFYKCYVIFCIDYKFFTFVFVHIAQSRFIVI